MNLNRRIRRGLCCMLYVAPAMCLYLARPVLATRAILLMGFGLFMILFIALTVVLPMILRKCGHENAALSWRRSAFEGSIFGFVMTCLWIVPYLPVGSFGVRLLICAVLCTVPLVALWWVDKRWLHYGIFKPD